jgi:hypothetical protein
MFTAARRPYRQSAPPGMTLRAGHGAGREKAMSMRVDEEVIRGLESWNYLYIVLGFALTIEGTLVQMATSWPYDFILYVALIALIALTTWVFLFTPFRGTLFRMKRKYEGIPGA